MSEAIGLGDIVECFRQFIAPAAPAVGTRYLVMGIKGGRCRTDGRTKIGIAVLPSDAATRRCWNPSYFRKIGPNDPALADSARADRCRKPDPTPTKELEVAAATRLRMPEPTELQGARA